MTVLFSAEQASRTSDLKVTERNAESAAELGEFPDSVKTLCGDLGQHLFLAECEICECTAV